MSTVETLELLDIEARVYRTDNDGDTAGDADFRIPGSIILDPTTFSDRLQEWAGDGTLSWDGTQDEYKDVITRNDRVEIVYRLTETGGETTGASFGAASYGEASYSGSDFSIHQWTGKASTPSFDTFTGPYHGDDNVRVTQYEVELIEYVFGILADRIIYGSYEGTVGDIIRDVVTEKCPEIDVSGVAEFEVETYREYDGTPINDVVTDLADTANAVIRSEGRTLFFEPLGDIPTQFTLTDSDFGGLGSAPDDSSQTTRVQVDGGTAINEDEVTGETSSDVVDYQTVTEDNRITYELDPEKNRIDRVDVWIRNTGAEEGVSVRIQRPNADGTGPRNEADDTIDIVSDSSGVALPDDGFRDRFRMSREALPDNPWMIIESGGVEGQDIGINADGDPVFRSWYPYRISVQVPADQDIIERYGLIERSYTDDSITRFETARDIGEATLEHNQHPDVDLTLEAMTRRTHALEAGHVVPVELPEYGSNYVGDYIVMERDREISGGVVRTNLGLQSVASL